MASCSRTKGTSVWSNDRVFEKMLVSGNPPDNWEQLLKEAKAQSDRFQGLIGGVD